MKKLHIISFLLFASLFSVSSANAQQYRTEIDEHYNRDFWESGNLRSKEPLVNGLREGIGEYYHDNGQQYSRIPWRNGRKHGSFTLYREDGTIEQELSYINGKMDGLIRWYHPNGKISTELNYKNNQMHGRGQWYNINGLLTHGAEYNNGKLVSSKRTKAGSDSSKRAGGRTVATLLKIVLFIGVFVLPFFKGRKRRAKSKRVSSQNVKVEVNNTPMSQEEFETHLAKQFRLATIIGYSMVMSLLIMFGIGYMFENFNLSEPSFSDDQSNSMIQIILVFISFILLVVSTRVKKIMLRQPASDPGKIVRLDKIQFINKLTNATIIGLGLSEAPIFMGFVLSRITGNFKDMILLGGISVVAIILNMPRYERGKEWIENDTFRIS